MNSGVIGVIGARSFVGHYILQKLDSQQQKRMAFSRKLNTERSQFYPLDSSTLLSSKIKLPLWISCAPIWVLPDYFPLFKQLGMQRIVALSSTSLITKKNSTDIKERELAKKIIQAEEKLIIWAAEQNIQWVILRSTLIYDLENDQNISRLLDFIQRFGFFPLCHASKGLRQPIHAEDVAFACVAALTSDKARNAIYSISGKDIMTYQEMVRRIFIFAEKKPRIIYLPRCILVAAIYLLKIIPKYRNISPAMLSRLEQDLVFDHNKAKTDFGFAPREFI